MGSKSSKSKSKAAKGKKSAGGHGSDAGSAAVRQPRGNAAAQEAMKIGPEAYQPYSDKYAADDLGPAYQVDEGQLTFDAEGTEGGKYHSRTASVPPAPSGVTIGRGYDIGHHDKEEVVEALTAAGLSKGDAAKYAAAAGKTGRAAKAWLAKNRSSLPEITPEQQEKLFEATYAEMAKDVQRISNDDDAVRKYGELDLEDMPEAMRDLVVDLRYRGDYTPKSRALLQEDLAQGDLIGATDTMSKRKNWRGVPEERFERRKKYLQEAEILEEGAAYGFTGMPMDKANAKPIAMPTRGEAPKATKP